MLWRLLYPLIFIYTIIDGMVTNYFFPAKAPYIFRDVFIIIVYFFFFINERVMAFTLEINRLIGSAATLAAAAFVLLCFGQIFNPYSPGLLLGILGFRVIFIYWPLALLAYVQINSFEKLKKFMRLILFVSVPVNLFGMAQYIVGPTLLYALYGPKIERAIVLAAVGDQSLYESFLRVIGTFASTGQYGNFLALNGILGFALLFSKPLHREKMIYMACLGLNFMALLASGTRSSLVFLVLSLGLFFFLNRSARQSIFMICITGLLMAGAFRFMGGRVVERFGSLAEVDMVKERTAGSTLQMFGEYLEKFPMGKGLGAASTAAVHLGKKEASTYQFIENYVTKLQIETGLIGVILYFLFVLLLLKRWFSSWLQNFQEPSANALILISCYCCVLLTVAGVFFIVDSPPVPIFLWTLVGIAARFSMPETLEDSPYNNPQDPNAYRTS